MWTTKTLLYKATIVLFCFIMLSPASWGHAEDRGIKKILDQQLQDSLDGLLTPEQLKVFKKTKQATEKAIRNPVPKLISRTIKISLRPGSPIPLLKVVPGYVASITVYDNTGQPWPVLSAIPGNKVFFQVERPEVLPGNGITVSALTDYAHTNVVSNLDGLSQMLNIHLSTVDPDKEKWETDSSISLQIDQRGPNASIPVVGEPMPSSITETVNAFIDGVPPINAVKLIISPQMAALDVWLYEEKLYVRSLDPVQWPRIVSIAPGAGGKLKVYETEKASSLLISHNGQTQVVGLEEPDYFN